MTEPVYRWQPITDVYKEEASKTANAEVDIEAEHKQKLLELQDANLRKPWTQKKAPFGIRAFTWYYFARAVICALLLLTLGAFPHSDFSTSLYDSMGNFLHMPGSKNQLEERRKEIEKVAQQYAVPENAIVDPQPVIDPGTMHTMVTVYLLFNLATSAVVGFMWWNRSWKVRWVAMFYSGALVGKAGINFIAGMASGVGSQIDASHAPLLMLTLAINGLIFLYLAFGPDVKQWFEPEY